MSTPKYHSNLLGSKRRDRERDKYRDRDRDKDRERGAGGNVTGDTNRSDKKSDSSKTVKEQTGGGPVFPKGGPTATEYPILKKDTYTVRTPSVGGSNTHGIDGLGSSESSWSTQTEAFCKVHPETYTHHTCVRTEGKSSIAAVPGDGEKEVKRKVKAALFTQQQNRGRDRGSDRAGERGSDRGSDRLGERGSDRGSDRAGGRSDENSDHRSKAKNIPQKLDLGKFRDRLSYKQEKKEEYSKDSFSNYDEITPQSFMQKERENGTEKRQSKTLNTSRVRNIPGYPSFPSDYTGTSGIMLEHKKKMRHENDQSNSVDNFSSHKIKEVNQIKKGASKENTSLHPAATAATTVTTATTAIAAADCGSDNGSNTVGGKTVYGKSLEKGGDFDRQKDSVIDEEFASNWRKNSKDKEVAADAHRQLRANQLTTELPSMSLSALLQLMLIRCLCLCLCLCCHDCAALLYPALSSILTCPILLNPIHFCSVLPCTA
jgi:hypothetical protein